MNKCKICKHTIVKEPFNDIKCMKRKHYIYNPDKYADCEYFEENVRKKTEKTEQSK